MRSGRWIRCRRLIDGKEEECTGAMITGCDVTSFALVARIMAFKWEIPGAGRHASHPTTVSASERANGAAQAASEEAK